MSTWAVSMVRDEADVIEGTLRHMADEGVAGIVVADNGSKDGTREILDALTGTLPCPLIVKDDPEVAYFQSRKMSSLAEYAAVGLGATWIVPFDADELWFASDRVGVVLDALPDHLHVMRAELYHHFRTAVDEDVTDPFQSMVWRQREPAPLPKVAFRWQPGAIVEPGNHGVTLPTVMSSGSAVAVGLSVRHFPYRSEDQFVTKATNGAEAYTAAGDAIPADIGAHWRQYGMILDRLGPDGLAQVYREHFWYLAPTESGLVRDPAPYRRWQT